MPAVAAAAAAVVEYALLGHLFSVRVRSHAQHFKTNPRRIEVKFIRRTSVRTSTHRK